MEEHRPEQSAVERRFGTTADEQIVEQVESMDFAEPGSLPVDDRGRIAESGDLAAVDKVHEETTTSIFTELGIVADEARAKALTTLLRGKTPASVIQQREGRGGKTFSYVPGWYVKKMLNALFALQWDFELIPMKEGELFNMTSRQVLVMGKLSIRDIHGKPRIIKMGLGKKDIVYLKGVDGKPSTIPVDIGNDIKAAETDSLKRCATGIGIALDLYAKED